ncbi:IMPAD1 [Mytilus coruscus]|uniref:inositol-phosphate phosphatase n=1 Tax=Mytilus coruscus TaxID=42192 RepID=A0A6J8ER21_MYTCO|nr:IMPAD1 [Mytilus coruscus]
MGPANVRINPVGGAVFIALGVCAALYMFGLPDWFHREPRVSMKELLSVCIQLAQEGGKRVKDVRLANRRDTQSHRAIVYGLAKAFPGLKVISEEKDLKPVNLLEIKDTNKHLTEVAETISSDQSISNSKITVWVDPLDATKEYTEKKLKYVATMVCVAVDGHPTIGVIHKPFVNDNKGETVWAWVGYGKSKTLEAVKTEKKEGDPDRIIVSISHKGDVESVAKAALGEKTLVLKGAGAGDLESVTKAALGEKTLVLKGAGAGDLESVAKAALGEKTLVLKGAGAGDLESVAKAALGEKTLVLKGAGAGDVESVAKAVLGEKTLVLKGAGAVAKAVLGEKTLVLKGAGAGKSYNKHVSIFHKGDFESVAKAVLGEKTLVLKGAGAGDLESVAKAVLGEKTLILKGAGAGDLESVTKAVLGEKTLVLKGAGAGDLESVAKAVLGEKILVLKGAGAGDLESVTKAVLGEKTQVLKGAGAGYKTLEVIKGNADAYLHTTKIKKWDLCAANAILSSMDGKMTTLQGDFIDYSSTTDKVVSDGLLVTLSNHFDYLKKLAGAMKKSDA